MKLGLQHLNFPEISTDPGTPSHRIEALFDLWWHRAKIEAADPEATRQREL